MSPKKLLVLTAVVAVLFGFIAFFERSMPSTGERERKGDLYWDIPTDKIERIEVTRGSEKLEFQRADPSHWKMIRPQKYPADGFAVANVASELAELKRAGGDSNDARPADYGLDKPVATATFEWIDPADPKVRKTRTLEFGAQVPGTDIVAARLAGTQKVLFVPASVLSSLKKSPEEFESKEVFEGPSAEISRLEILRGRGRLMLVRKDGAWWLAEPFADLADSGEADRLVGQLTALRAREFVHGSDDLAAQGLNPPLFRVTLTDAKGTATSVDFGAMRSDGNAMYARREGQVFTVDRDVVDELSKEAEPFRSAALLAFNRGDVSSLEGSFGKDVFALAQKDGGWTAAGRPILAAAADDIDSTILGLKSKGYLDEADAKALGPPMTTVTVMGKAGSAWTLSLHPRGDEMAARVSSRPGGFLVDPAAPGQLEAAFRKAITVPTPKAAKKP